MNVGVDVRGATNYLLSLSLQCDVTFGQVKNWLPISTLLLVTTASMKICESW